MTARRTAAALVTALAVTGALLLWPAKLGGVTSFVVTHGVSMLPRFHTGDLAIVRSSGSYHVGEVVAYHSATLHTVVLHRIVAESHGRFTFKGDHNSWLDPDHPTQAQLVGKLWIHLPKAGAVVRWLLQPTHLALLIVALLMLTGGEATRRRSRRPRHQPAAHARRQPQKVIGPPRVRPPLSAWPRDARDLAAGALVVALLGAMLAFLGWSRPISLPSRHQVGYSQQLRFDYGGSAQPGPAYPQGRFHTGDAVFTPLVHDLAVTATYRFGSSGMHAVGGTASMSAVVSNAAGWHQSLPVPAAVRFTGDSARVTATVTPSALLALAAAVDRNSQLALGGYRVTFTPQVDARGTVAGKPLQATDSAPFVFRFDASQFTPVGGQGDPQTVGYTATQSGSVAVAALRAARLGLPLHRTMSVSLARRAGPALTLLGLLAAWAGAASARRRARRIGGCWLPGDSDVTVISVVADALPDDLLVIDTASFDDLLAAAAAHQSPVLHDKANNTCYVDHDRCVYRFRFVELPREAEPVEPSDPTTAAAAAAAMGASVVPLLPRQRREQPHQPSGVARLRR